MYKELSTQLNFPQLEQDILNYWEENDIFKKTIESRDPANSFVFYEGPPTANGRPGIHHVISRTIKDFVCRLKTMQGYRVERKAGWDTHGLPVEIEVEKELGFTNKDDIEAYGVEKFNRKCRESVWKYKQEWDEITKRIAFWVDLENPYITYENDYIESIWWLLSEFWKKELIYQGHKILPYCPRCETPLSSHEVSQGYKDVKDPSVYVRMRLKGEENTSFLVWTTTPWTLISNVAVALHSDIKYVKVKQGDEFLILAEARLSVLENDYEIVQEFQGSELAELSYEPLFTFCQTEKKIYYSVTGDFVTTEDGSGIVHIAPAFGEDDYKIGLKYDLPVLQPIDESGKFTEEVTSFKGTFVKSADPGIIADLDKRGLLYKSETYLHSYPHCWRCRSPLLYYAKKSWYIRTTAIKEQLIKHNKTVTWYPKEVGSGRFGEWLENNVDWSLSRDRYWGTPLPIWLCSECGHGHCIGSVEELNERAGLTEKIDLHKPYIDEVEFECEKCQGKMIRTPEVIDCWFDSGSMPVAQWHYPFENQDVFRKNFPADFIAEGIDQTRGWFYSLLAIAVLQFDQPCYRMCISNDLILDKHGQKMSKTKGNTVAPKEILGKFGADALRWYLLTVSPPWIPTRFDPDGVQEVMRKFLGTLVNVYSFFAIYANIDQFNYQESQVAVEKRTEIDRWLSSSLNTLVTKVNDLLSRFDMTRAARSISEFVIDDLSNWYVRRCRRRFWKSEMGEDKLAAYETLYEVLYTVSKLLAPFTPFLSDELYLNLTQGKEGEFDSVHMAAYPQQDREGSFTDRDLEDRMNNLRRIVLLGRSLRNESGLKVRQPLSRLIIVTREHNTREQIERMAGLIIEELNVKDLEFISDQRALTVRKAIPQFKQLGPRFGKEAKSVAELIRNLADAEISTLQMEGSLSLSLNGAQVEIKPDDVEIVSESAEGLAVQSENDLTVAIDTRITHELKLEGLAREFVNRVQNIRKNAGFDVIDRINIYYQASGDLLKAIETQSAYICNETLADNISSDSGNASYQEELSIEGIKTQIGLEKIVN
ncbi:MAG: isoleucine--tRNA ligase [bacterium]